MLQSFGVFLRTPQGGVEFVEVQAESRQLAARMAEHLQLGARASAVMARWNIAGRCVVCQAVLFEDDRPRQIGQAVRCRDC